MTTSPWTVLPLRAGVRVVVRVDRLGHAQQPHPLPVGVLGALDVGALPQGDRGGQAAGAQAQREGKGQRQS